MSNIQSRTKEKSSKRFMFILLAGIIVIIIAAVFIINGTRDNESQVSKAPIEADALLPLLQEMNPNVYSISIDAEKDHAAIYMKSAKIALNKSTLINVADENLLLIQELLKNKNVKAITVTLLNSENKSDEDKRAVQFTFNESQNINYDDLKNKFKSNYPEFYNSASSYYISPEIWRGISGEDHMKFTNRDRIK